MIIAQTDETHQRIQSNLKTIVIKQNYFIEPIVHGIIIWHQVTCLIINTKNCLQKPKWVLKSKVI